MASYRKKFGALVACLLVLSMVAVAVAQDATQASASPKYVFFFIGDGMGANHCLAAERYLRGRELAAGGPGEAGLVMSRFPTRGTITTSPFGGGVTDSAAAGTALACGMKTRNGRIAFHPETETPLPTIAELAHARGMKVGVLSTTPVDHATPAAYYAHVPSRYLYADILNQLAACDLDVVAGYGALGLKTKQGEQDRAPLETARRNGFTIVETPEAFRTLEAGDGRVVSIACAMEPGERIGETDYAPTLPELVAKGIELLDNPEGFFIMAEGGRIDWAGHANDGPRTIHETLAFDEAIAVALRFYEARPDETLIVVTADHETGGLSLDPDDVSGEALYGALAAVRPWPANGAALMADLRAGNVTPEDAVARLSELLGLKELTAEEAGRLKEAYASEPGKGPDPVQAAYVRIMNDRAGLRWSVTTHTDAAVPVFALGAGHVAFRGDYENTDIFEKFARLMALRTPAAATP
jgi:alkaline phosphatase